jgi:PAS domain S-box-containing protein
LFWATLRFAERGASTAAVAITVLATIGTIQGSGPFVGDTVNESLLLLQAFIGVTIIPSLFLAGVLAERKKTQEALEKNELRFRSFVENANDVLFALTPSGIFSYVSPQWKEVTGYELSETIGQPFTPFVHPDDVSICTEFLQRVIGKGEKQNGVEYRVRCKDGTYLWYTANASLAIDSVNDTPILIGIGRNMTDRKKAEKALSESENKFRTLFENSMDMISLTTPDGKIIDVNPAGVNLSGYPSKEALLSLSIQDIYADPNDRARLLELMNKNGFVTDFETILLHHDGQKKQVSINASAVRDELGKVTAIQGIIRDITEHRKLEVQLRHSQKMEAIGLLAGGIAHDFNNILTVFLTYGSMLRDKLKNDAVLKSYAEQIIESTDRAVDLTRGLLAFSRKQTLTLKPIDLNEAVRNTMKFLQRIIGEDVEVKARLADSKLMVTADSGQIGQVLMNIATNARDAMPHGGLLSIQTETMLLGDTDVKTGEVEKAGPYACISIADTGQGMDTTTMDRIFEPFFTTKAVGKGTGLGLAIVYGIIKQHCGTIRVYSEPGTGTVFKIYLPLASSATAKPGDDALPVLRGKHETILLVEDNAAVRATIKTVLEDGGYSVIEAVDGDDATAEFNKHRDEIALLLTDVIMPKKNGKELYDMIRGIRPDIKALFISGYTADIITSKGLLNEGLHLMNKPLAPDPLKRRIREILDSGQDYHE